MIVQQPKGVGAQSDYAISKSASTRALQMIALFASAATEIQRL